MYFGVISKLFTKLGSMGVNLKLIDIILTQQSDPTNTFGSVAAATQFTVKEKKAKFNVFFLKGGSQQSG